LGEGDLVAEEGFEGGEVVGAVDVDVQVAVGGA